MRVYTRYKALKRQWSSRNALSGLLAFAGLAFLVWVFLRSVLPPETGPARRPGPSSATNRLGRITPLPAAGTNLAAQRLAATVPTNKLPEGRPSNVVASATATPAPPELAPRGGATERPVQNVLEAQVAMAALGISCGSLDGVLGGQTRAALRAFQQRENLPLTGLLDPDTRHRLRLTAPPLTTYTVTTNDIARLLPLSPTWLGKSQQARLDYETVLELVAENSRSHPGLIQRLNPGIDWSTALAGLSVTVPNVTPPALRSKAATIRIHLAGKTLEAFDANANLLAHVPCSIARLVEKRPVGALAVVAIIHNPNYTFNPDLFPESAEGRRLGRKVVLPPGPNNPVGTAWIGLDRPGYGIHGTPRPEEVGRTESHGCFRLANWDAEFLTQIVAIGTPVYVEP